MICNIEIFEIDSKIDNFNIFDWDRCMSTCLSIATKHSGNIIIGEILGFQRDDGIPNEETSLSLGGGQNLVQMLQPCCAVHNVRWLMLGQCIWGYSLHFVIIYLSSCKCQHSSRTRATTPFPQIIYNLMGFEGSGMDLVSIPFWIISEIKISYYFGGSWARKLKISLLASSRSSMMSSSSQFNSQHPRKAKVRVQSNVTRRWK